MFTSDDPLRVEYVDGHAWVLLEDFVYTDAKLGRIVVPAGFVTDFASIPRLFWNVLPPTGTYGKAAVIHDYLYRYQTASRADADRILRDASKELGSRWAVRWVIWTAVRGFGGFTWRRHRKAQ